MSADYQSELRFLGIESSPAFVREPEGNGVSERFIRTLKEQLLWVRYFATVEELRLAPCSSSRTRTTASGWLRSTATARRLKCARLFNQSRWHDESGRPGVLGDSVAGVLVRSWVQGIVRSEHSADRHHYRQPGVQGTGVDRSIPLASRPTSGS